MKRLNSIALLVLTTLSLSSCEIIGGIFKAGVWSGILMVVVVLALIIWLISKLFSGRQGD